MAEKNLVMIRSMPLRAQLILNISEKISGRQSIQRSGASPIYSFFPANIESTPCFITEICCLVKPDSCGWAMERQLVPVELPCHHGKSNGQNPVFPHKKHCIRHIRQTYRNSVSTKSPGFHLKPLKKTGVKSPLTDRGPSFIGTGRKDGIKAWNLCPILFKKKELLQEEKNIMYPRIPA
jgi:hypothetical protein